MSKTTDGTIDIADTKYALPDKGDDDYHELTVEQVRWIENQDGICQHHSGSAVKYEDDEVWAICWVNVPDWVSAPEEG